MRQETKELIAGIIFFAISALFFSLVFLGEKVKSGNGSFSTHYKVNASFQDIEGVYVGAPVRVAGVNVGKVTGVELSDAFRSLVHMSISKDVVLPDDSAIVVESDGLFGGKYLEILPGAEDFAIANDGNISYAQDAMRISTILERVLDYTKQRIKQCNECMVKMDKENL